MKHINSFTISLASLMIYLGLRREHPVHKAHRLYDMGKITAEERSRRIAKYIQKARRKAGM